MTTLLAVDLGKTGCRARVSRDGQGGGDVEVPGARGLADPSGTDAAAAAIQHAAELLDCGPVDLVSVGAAGLGRDRERSPALLDALAAVFPAAALTVSSDMTTAHVGAFEGGPGVVLAVGTGSVALAVGAAGYTVVDGWGYLVGDDGSGYAVGRAGLAVALRHHDGRSDASGALPAAAEARFGPLDALPAVVHGATNPPAVVASFAHDVITAARSGDQDASAICDGAARELAATAIAAADRVFGAGQPAPVAFAGGLVRHGGPFHAPVDTCLRESAPHLRIREAVGTPLDGAARLAREPTPLHAALVAHREANR